MLGRLLGTVARVRDWLAGRWKGRRMDCSELRLKLVESRLEAASLKIDKLLLMAELLLREVAKMSPELMKVKDKVTELETVIGGVVTLLGTLSQMIKDSVDDKAALLALADSIEADKKALADAVLANTPGV